MLPSLLFSSVIVVFLLTFLVPVKQRSDGSISRSHAFSRGLGCIARCIGQGLRVAVADAPGTASTPWAPDA